MTNEKRGGGKGRDPYRKSRHWKRYLYKHPPKAPRGFKEGDVFGVCARCARSFVPDWNKGLDCFSRCCSTCQIRNLADAMSASWLYDNTGVARDEHSIV